ncbi:MAG: ABC transporter permease [Planctomycetota bacterium]
MTGSLAMERTADARRLLLRGRLVLNDGQPSWAELREAVRANPDLESLDLSGIERIDGAGAAWLLALRADAARGGRRIEFLHPRPQTQRLLDLYRCPSEFSCLKDAPRETPVLAEIGATTMDLVRGFRGVLVYSGDLVFALFRVLRNPRSLNWGEVPRLIERAGADAVPIVLMINFLIGLIVALQAAEQLQRFGANQLLADLVGLSLTRELAPLITAILVAGRSGAAFAAELGTMRVNEEIDALRTLGIDPERHLVLPRVVALALVAPILTALGMAIGILAGMLIGMIRLDLTPIGYWNELALAVRSLDVAEGLTKSLVFAMIATFIACQRGLAARGGAAGVGLSTTSAVVTIIFHLVAADALLSITFNALRG